MDFEQTPRRYPMKPPQTGSAIIIVALILASLVGNYLVTAFLYELESGAGTNFLTCLALGILTAQPCLLAIWGGMGVQKFVLRIPLTFGIAIFLTIAYIGSLTAKDEFIPLEVNLIIIAHSLTLMLLIEVPLWLLRWKTNVSISRQSPRDKPAHDAQFGIKHLMIFTTVAAGVVATTQYAFQKSEFLGDAPWGEIAGFFVTMAVFVALLTLLTVALVFAEGYRKLAATLLGLHCLVGPFVATEIVNKIRSMPTQNWIEFLVNLFGFTITLVSSLVVIMMVFHSIGFKLNRPIAK